MPGISSTVNKDWAACSFHHHITASRDHRHAMDRPSLPPVSALHSHAVAHNDPVRPRWTSRHSTPPTVSATERSLSPISALRAGRLTPPNDHDFDDYVTWAANSSYLYPQSHNGSPTGSNMTAEDDWSDLSNDYKKVRSTSSSLSSASSLSSLPKIQLASEDQQHKVPEADPIAGSINGRHVFYAHDGFEELNPTPATPLCSNGWLEADTVRASSGGPQTASSLRSPTYTAGVLPKYRATEPVLCDRRYEEALRIANSDFDRRQREADALRHEAELSGLLQQVRHLAVNSSNVRDAEDIYLPYAGAATSKAGLVQAQAQALAPYPLATAAQRPYSYLVPPAYTSTHLPRDSLSLASDPFASPLPTARPSGLVSNPDPLPSAPQGFTSKKKESLYKTELCRGYEERGHCDYGAKCQFAHGKHELRSIERHPKWKTERCRTYWRYGTCPYAKRCCFIHEASEGDMSAGLSPPEATSKAPLLARVRAISENVSPPTCQVDVESQPYASFARSAPSFISKSTDQEAQVHQQYQLQQQRPACVLSTLARGVPHHSPQF